MFVTKALFSYFPRILGLNSTLSFEDALYNRNDTLIVKRSQSLSLVFSSISSSPVI